MRIAFDGAPLGEGPITGVGRAFLNALTRYARDPFAECLLLLPDGAPDPRIDGVEVVAAPRGAVGRQRLLPRLLRANGCALLHSPVAALPLLARCRTVATVHDLPWLHREAGESTGLRERLATRWSLRKADAVLAPSRFTQLAAQRLLGARRGARVHLVPHGFDAPTTTPPPSTRTGPLLTIGDDRPRKNRAGVRRAFALARARHPGLPELRFLGPPDDYVSEADKARLLASCCALVQCSLFEGFGLPVLEGLAHGAPIVCSDLMPHREIAGDAAWFVDPRSPEDMARGLVRVCTDQALRARLAAAGPLRAEGFPVAATAARWRELHEALLR